MRSCIDQLAVIKRYEEGIAGLNKETKRLQTSLKEMVVTNRVLRDQVSLPSYILILKLA